jgi:chemotaxis receptor (MCP) glutamine deamidase CheD
MGVKVYCGPGPQHPRMSKASPPSPPAPPFHDVPVDHYEVLKDDGVLRATLDGSIVVCVYDAVEEAGGMVHLRILPTGFGSREASDETLAADLLLLDRCLSTLQTTAPTSRNWQARLVTHYGADGILQPIGNGVLHSVTHACQDSGVRVVQSDAESGAPVTVGFRPAMGQLRKL